MFTPLTVFYWGRLDWRKCFSMLISYVILNIYKPFIIKFKLPNSRVLKIPVPNTFISLNNEFPSRAKTAPSAPQMVNAMTWHNALAVSLKIPRRWNNTRRIFQMTRANVDKRKRKGCLRNRVKYKRTQQRRTKFVTEPADAIAKTITPIRIFITRIPGTVTRLCSTNASFVLIGNKSSGTRPFRRGRNRERKIGF